MTTTNKPGARAARATRKTGKIPALRPILYQQAGHALIYICIIVLSMPAFSASGAATNRRVAVTTAEVENRDLTLTVRGIGTIEAIRHIMIRPEISGLLESVHFEEGSFVEKDKLLFLLDDQKIKEQLKAKQAGLEEARANLENARRVYNRRQSLYKQDLGTEAARDEAEARYKAISAQVERLKAEIAGTRESLADARIRAQFAGFIGERYVDSGEWVGVGTELAPLIRIDRLKIAFTVPGKYVGQVETGQKVTLYPSAASDKTFTGSVYFVSPMISEATRSLLVKAYIDNSGKSLLPGGFGTVDLVLDVFEDRPVIPEEALIPTRSGYIVFVVKEETAIEQEVEIGLRKPGYVEITKGLNGGETIIRSGHISVKNRDKLRIVE